MLRHLLAASLVTMCAGCAASGNITPRALPDASVLVPAALPVPPVREGQDAKAALAEALAVAAENGRRLQAARRLVEQTTKSFEEP